MASSVVKYGDSIKVSEYKKYANGAVNVGCLVVLVRESDSVEIGRIVTDKYGYYEFIINSPQVGLYQIQFYGSNTIEKFEPDGDWEKFEITSDMVNDLNPLEYDDDPTMVVSEFNSRIDVNKNEIFIFEFLLTD